MAATADDRPDRKLAAIMVADVAGYARLMGFDEVGTLAQLNGHRAILTRLIDGHGGRIANTAGDGLLAEFPSAVNAVDCAVAVQAKLAEANEAIPHERRVAFRIGIHVGDVIVQAVDLFGDGVNIAARVQALAEPGGICLSVTALEHVRKRLPHGLVDLGAHSVKKTSPSRSASSRSTCRRRPWPQPWRDPPGPTPCRCRTSPRSRSCPSPT